MFQAFICLSSGDTPNTIGIIFVRIISAPAINRNKLEANNASCWSYCTDVYYQYTVLLNINKYIMMQVDVDIVVRSNVYGVCVQ
jgi:hypothetical protein